jgi:hypothetical protein
MRLRPVRRYRNELRRRGRIRAQALVTYVASRGGRRSTASISVVFRQAQAARKRGRKGLG